MFINKIPLFEKLKDSKNILLAGAGGGFDIFSGLPLYFSLKNLGKQVHLANLSFTRLGNISGKRLTPHILEVDINSKSSEIYFPEKYLSQWFKENGETVSIHCFSMTGVKPLTKAYQALCEALKIDTIILIDGGTDSLMRGDEVGLGTPEEDMASLAAVNELDIETKLLTCIGFGVDTYHGVCHAQFLEAVADLTKKKGFLGMFSLLDDMNEVIKYKEAVDFVFKLMPRFESIVSASIVSAIEGEYGNYHKINRTKLSKLWINPLMNLYWSFELDAVVERSLYLDKIINTKTRWDISLIIEKFRYEICPVKKWENIPS